MTTFSDLTDEVILRLSGYTQKQDQSTHLTAALDATAMTFAVADGTTLSRGVVEIDDELIWVDTFDRGSGTAMVPPYGRGFRNTDPAAHVNGSRVVIAPAFPRSLVKTALNDAILGVYPDLYGTFSSTFSFNAARTTYDLPPDAIDVLQVTWQTIGPTREWLPIRKWRIDKNANTGAFYTGKSLSVYDGITAGRTVNVVYAKRPATLELPSDDFSQTGLPDSAKEVVVLGAAYRVASYLDAGRIVGTSAETDIIDQQSPIGSAGTVTRSLFALYQARLASEVRRQDNTFPVRVHYTR